MYHFSCGHSSNNLKDGVTVTCKEYTESNSKALAYKVVCRHCYHLYKKEQLVFYTDKDAENWLLNV